MRCRTASARDGDMRQRCQVMERKPLAVKIGAQLSISNTRTDCDGPFRRIDCNHFVHWLQRQERVLAIGNIVEAMTRAKYLQVAFLLVVLRSVTVRFAESIAITLSIGFNDRNASLLSAILLKQ